MRQQRLMPSISLSMITFLLSAIATGDATAAVYRDVPYIDDGDAKHHADVYVPDGEGPFPGVLMIHGGAWTTGSKGHMLGHARTLVDAGYTVVSINYRLAPKHKFPAQVDDCKAALRWMRGNAPMYKIDPTRIATYGYSAGGHLAALLGTTDPDDGLEGSDVPEDAPGTRVQCVIAGGAPCEFRTMPKNAAGLAYWLGGTRGEEPEVYQRASPTHFATKDDPPVFFFHGEKDTLVRPNSPKALQAALQAHGIKCQYFEIEGKEHIGAFLDSRGSAEAVKFLDAVLKQE